MNSLILFDFDGVIIDSHDMALQAYQSFDPSVTDERFQSWFDGNLYDSMSSEENRVVSESKSKVVKLYASQVNTQRIFPGIDIVIEQATKKSLLAIVSSGSKHTITQFLDTYGLLTHFVDILGFEDGYSKKDKISSLRRQYKKETEQCLFVTDTLGDITEARAADVPSIAVTWGFHSKEKLQEGNPLEIVDSPQNLLSKIEFWQTRQN